MNERMDAWTIGGRKLHYNLPKRDAWVTDRTIHLFCEIMIESMGQPIQN